MKHIVVWIAIIALIDHLYGKDLVIEGTLHDEKIVKELYFFQVNHE